MQNRPWIDLNVRSVRCKTCKISQNACSNVRQRHHRQAPAMLTLPPFPNAFAASGFGGFKNILYLCSR